MIYKDKKPGKLNNEGKFLKWHLEKLKNQGDNGSRNRDCSHQGPLSDFVSALTSRIQPAQAVLRNGWVRWKRFRECALRSGLTRNNPLLLRHTLYIGSTMVLLTVAIRLI